MHLPAMRAGWLAIPLALVIACASMFVQIQPASADTDLDIGGEARVSYTGGDSIRVRSTPSYDGSVVTSVPEGWLVAILDGPISDGEGSQWYKVTARGQTGYMVSDYLARPGSSGSSTSGSQTSAAATMYTTTSLRLRASASTSGAILLVMPAGASVSTTGTTQNGYSQLTYQGTTGWAASQYLSSNPPSSGSGTVISNAWVIGGSLNLRSGASMSSSVLLVMPGGAQVGVTGSPQNGYTPVRYNGTDGWAYSQYLSATEPGGNEPEPTTAPTAETRYATTSLNLRSGAGTSFGVLTVIPSGAAVTVTGGQTNGYVPVTYNGTSGYASATYLSTSQSQPTPTATPDPGNSGELLVWPVHGGTWTIIQGYNGGTHQNRGSTADYYYSMDIQKTAGGSATQGEPVYAPASGTVLWTSGGLLIGMGNGYGIAMFHITIDSSIRSGVEVTQGQYVGYVSGPGGSGYQVTPHIDLTLWRLPNGGGSPRISTAFTGDFAISGYDYPDIGVWNMHGGKTFTP